MNGSTALATKYKPYEKTNNLTYYTCFCINCKRFDQDIPLFYVHYSHLQRYGLYLFVQEFILTFSMNDEKSTSPTTNESSSATGTDEKSPKKENIVDGLKSRTFRIPSHCDTILQVE